MSKLTELYAIKEIARYDREGIVRKSAVERINDQEFLANCVANDSDWQVRKAALYRINDYNILHNLLTNVRDQEMINLLNQHMRGYSYQ